MDPKKVPLYPKFRIPPPSPPQHSSASTSFPILALSILGILTTSILLLSYYIFVIKCCLNWRHADVITRLSRSRILHRRSRSRRPRDYPPAAYSAAVESRGLDESAIRSIPTFRYRKAAGDSTTTTTTTNTNDCAVCLSEFQEEERIRLLPNCLHLFHIDCIDTWLQSNANCPLCRSPITAINPMLAATQFTEPSNGHNPDHQHDETVIEVVISGESHEQNHPQMVASPRKGEELIGLEKGKRLQNGGSMGDECIEVRSKDESFCIQPMRRSFSMDSSSDKQLYLALQGILQKNPHFQEICGTVGESSSSSSSSSGRARRPFFSFGNHRSSRSAVLPI